MQRLRVLRALFLSAVLLPGPLLAETVGYVVLGDPKSTDPEAPILEAGHDPVAIRDLPGESLEGIDLLWVVAPFGLTRPELIESREKVLAFVRGGGAVIFHDPRGEGIASLVPGAAGVRVTKATRSQSLDAAAPSVKVVTGPAGVLTESILDASGSPRLDRYAEAGSLPEGAVTVLSRANRLLETVDFTYAHASGFLYFSLISPSYFLGSGSSDPQFRRIYPLNLLAFMMDQIRDGDGDGLSDRLENRYGGDAGLEPAADLDADGLSNLAEVQAGTRPDLADTDGDGLRDLEEVTGTRTDPLLADTDGDGFRDPQDPFPRARLLLEVETAPAATAGSPTALRCRLRDPSGDVGEGRHARFTLTVSGSAVLLGAGGGAAIVSGAGTPAALLEASGTEFEVTVEDDVLEEVRCGVIDGGIGISIREEFLSFDFESGDGGFVHRNGRKDLGTWKRGRPEAGPGSAHGGSAAWFTRTDWPNRPAFWASVVLGTPTFALPSGASPVLRFYHHYDSAGRDPSPIWVDGEGFSTAILASYQGSSTGAGWRQETLDLSPYAGGRVEFRFDFRGGPGKGPGWSIDDLSLENLGPPKLRFLAGKADEDGDGLANGREIARETDPFIADTDGDGLSDAVETDTGVWVSTRDTGTEPLRPDTDGGRLSDGAEAARGLNPLDARDDLFPHVLGWLRNVSPGGEDGYVKLLDDARAFESGFDLEGSVTSDPAVLRKELGDRDVLLFSEGSSLEQGIAFRDALREFVDRGGVIIAHQAAGADLLRGAGLIDAAFAGGRPRLPLAQLRLAVRPDHPLVSGLALPLEEPPTLEAWEIRDPDATVLFTREGDGLPVVAARRVGAGGVVLVGLGLDHFDQKAGQVLAVLIAQSWFLADRDVDGIPDRVEVLNGLDPLDPADAEGDLDGDGLKNGAEFIAGSSLSAKDSDGDGLEDGVEVLARGTDPTRADSDGDGAPDGQDPFPRSALRVVITGPREALTGSPVTLTCRAMDPGGSLVAEAPIRFTISASGGAVFSETAARGSVLAGGGTGTVKVETAGGIVEIGVSQDRPGTVLFETFDTERFGLEGALADRVIDFEANDGGFTHGGENDVWEWGVPTSGPGAAASGRKLWATDLAGNLPEFSESWLESPPLALPRSGSPRFSFRSLLFLPCPEPSLVKVQISVDGGEFTDLTDLFLDDGRRFFRCVPLRREFVTVSGDLSPHAGKTVRLRFFLQHILFEPFFAGWYVDDLTVSGLPEVLFLSPDLDADSDGLSNGEEIARGSSPLLEDGDFDGLPDRVETNTRVFAGPNDAGTDPRNPDSDGGGLPDGRELERGTNPLNRADDRVVRIATWVAYGQFEQRHFDPLNAVRRFFPDFSIRDSFAADGADLAKDLEGIDVFLAAGLSQERISFEPFAEAIREFTERGGVVISDNGRLLDEAGLVHSRAVQGRSQSALSRLQDLQVVGPDHPLARGVDPLLVGKPFQVGCYLVEDARADVVVERMLLDATVVAVRRFGAGAAVLIGLDFGDSGGDSARVLANAVEWSHLLCDSDGDGIPDRVEISSGLDPREPADAAGDLDGDGLTNVDEYREGSDPGRKDTDGDGLGDLQEIAGETDPAAADTDGDGVPDPTDSYPSSPVQAWVEAPAAALAGAPARITCRLFDDEGRAIDGVPLRFTLRADGGAVFSAAAIAGRVLSGAGSGEIVVESEGGVVTVELARSSAGPVVIDVADSAGVGLSAIRSRLFDFEADDGGFRPFGLNDPWEWGIPVTRPAAAASGTRVWGTNLEGDYPSNADAVLDSPAFVLPASTRPALSFRYFHEGECFNDRAGLAISTDGGPFLPLAGLEDAFGTPFNCAGEPSGPLYRTAGADLSAFAGHRVRFRFLFSSNVNRSGPGFYLDDFAVSFAQAEIRFFDPPADEDGDGLPNALEIARGTDPRNVDSDSDGLADRVETGTGKFSGTGDTGTDPLVADTDGGGIGDGGEVQAGLDPFDPQDDFRPSPSQVALIDGAGYQWEVLAENRPVRAGLLEWGWRLEVNGEDFSVPELRARRNGREVVAGPRTVGPLEVTRSFFVPPYLPDGEAAFLRVIDSFSNPSGAPLPLAATVSGSLRPGNRSEVIATSSGDAAVGADDHWVVLDSGEVAEYPPLSLVIGAPSAALSPSSFTHAGGHFEWTFRATVPAGGTLSLLTLTALNPNRAAAADRARSLLSLPGRTLEGIAAPVQARIVNFNLDRDGDGIPDAVEIENGLDPDDPLDARGDLDGDGLTNLEEFTAGTRLRDADTDGDGLDDRREAVVLGTDPRLRDTDGDGVEDAVDLFPRSILRVSIETPAVALAGTGVKAVCRLVDGTGDLVPGSFRFTVSVTNGAVFAVAATRGRIISGGGTAAVLLEPEDGIAEVEVSAAEAGTVLFDVLDPDGVGIRLGRRDLTLDFERDGGGFVPGGQPELWEWGTPVSGPLSAASGRRVWATRLAGDYEPNAEAFLDSPAIPLPAGTAPVLRFRHYLDAECCCDAARVQVSAAGGEFADLADLDSRRQQALTCPAIDGYRQAGADLAAFAGNTVRIRFLFTSDGAGEGPGWYLDDFSISGLKQPAVEFVRPGGDEDGDRVENATELARGTDVFEKDTDADGLPDGVESNTGVFLSEADTGTDPLESDTDRGGVPDGREVARLLSPFDASDDRPMEVVILGPDLNSTRSLQNTQNAVRRWYPDVSFRQTAAREPSELRAALKGAPVLLVAGDQGGWTFAQGKVLAEAIQEFVAGGGVAIGQHPSAEEVLRGAGLIEAGLVSVFDGLGEPPLLSSERAGHPFLAGVVVPFPAAADTGFWTSSDPEAVPVLAGSGDRGAVLLTRFFRRPVAGPPAEVVRHCAPAGCPAADQGCCSEDVLEITFPIGDRNDRSVFEYEEFDGGAGIDVAVVLDTASDGIQAWAFNVRHEVHDLALDEESLTLEGTDAGEALGESNFQLIRAIEGGFTSAVVLSLNERAVLPAARRNVLARARYALLRDVGVQGTPIEIAGVDLSVNGATREPAWLAQGRVRKSGALGSGAGSTVLLGFDLDALQENVSRVVANTVGQAHLFTDRDGDGLPTLFEIESGLDPRDAEDGRADLDGDGLPNALEFALGSSLRESDSDGDGIGDGAEVARGTDPRNPDTDGDGSPDALDPFPKETLRVQVEAAAFGVVEVPSTITCRTLDSRGNPVPEPALRFTLTASGSAVFSETAKAGTVIAGGGTNAVLLEPAAGLVEIEVSDAVAEEVRFDVIDSEKLGMRLDLLEFFADFEEDRAGFRPAGSADEWEWGEPTSGPRSAVSGRRVWATNLSGDYSNGSVSALQSPPIVLSADHAAELSFWHYYRGEYCCDGARVQVSVDGGEFGDLPGIEGNDPQDPHRFICDATGGRFVKTAADLSEYRGRSVRFQFLFESDSTVGAPGWYVDDVAVRRLRRPGIDFSDGVVLPLLAFENRARFHRGDADGSGLLDVTDAILVLLYLFRGGPPPAAPGPPGGSCGPDPDALRSPGDLGCEFYGGC